MKVVKDNRLDEIKRIEDLLYGKNYAVWLNLYGPLNPDISLEDALRCNVSKNAEISGVVPSSAKEAEKEIMEQVFYQGDESSGPLELDKKRDEITSLMNKILSDFDLKNADFVSEFSLKEGRPAYPIFWDFAYDIHSNGKRWIFIGSSSD